MKWKECEIPLKDGWYIKSDPYQFILVQKRKYENGKNKGEWYFDTGNASYYKEIPILLEEWGKKLVRMGGYKTIQGIVTGIRDTQSVLEEIAFKCSLKLEEK